MFFFGNHLNTFVAYWLPVVIYCSLIFMQSSYSSYDGLPQFGGADKLWHFCAYAVLGALFYRAFSNTPINQKARQIVLISIVCASVYGLSDEIHQYFVPSRQASLADWGADIFGSIGGVCCYRLLYLKIKTSNTEIP
jgi:VanZ family protein